MKVIKRKGAEQEFNIDKLRNAITKASNSVDKEHQMPEEDISKAVNSVKRKLHGFNSINVEDIHDIVEQTLSKKNYEVGKAYIIYREEKKKKKRFTENEEKVLCLIDGESETLRGDNANKHIDDNGSISDYMAGILSKSLFEKTVDKDIVKAHKNGWIHWHDSDYFARPMHNCDVINGEDMFENHFQMQNTLIEPNEETPFRTICNLFAQINLIVSGRQYGGQTISWSHALPYIDYTRQIIKQRLYDRYNNEDKLIKNYRKFLHFLGKDTGLYDIDGFNEEVETLLRAEIYEGVKTYQYQILCHSSSNGQTPFVSNNLCLREAVTQQELDDFAMLIEEIFKRRIKGIKDASGHYVTALFPKLLYWTCDGLNVDDNDPYFYLTELAAKCEISRTQPDIVSEKQTRLVKKGQIIPSMGCRSLLGPIWEKKTYPVNTKMYWNYTLLDENDCKDFTIETMTAKDFENAAYDYDMFDDKYDFVRLKNGNYHIGQISVNFRGNTGWVLEKNDETVTILEPKVYGRFNCGVITINLPHVALTARQNMIDKYLSGEQPSGDEQYNKYKENILPEFYRILDERLDIVRRALKIRYNYVQKIKGKNSEILWCHGALSRIGQNDTVGDLMKQYPDRASISVGFVGLYETCEALINQSNTTEEGRKLSKEILSYMNNKCNEWKSEDNMNYSIYGTPEESLTYKFALANRKDFGYIDKITDKDYVVNSYHVDPREVIDAFTKLEIEGEYLALSSGGAVSYVEIPELKNNTKVIIDIIKWMHNHIVYAEFNTILGICYKCGYEGNIPLSKTEDGNFIFTCPKCGNTDDSLLSITARICGYLGTVNAGNTNKGRLYDILSRVLHLDNFEDNQIYC